MKILKISGVRSRNCHLQLSIFTKKFLLSTFTYKIFIFTFTRKSFYVQLSPKKLLKLKVKVQKFLGESENKSFVGESGNFFE